jgi:hypothetical protein
VSLISREPNLRFEKISISRTFLWEQFEGVESDDATVLHYLDVSVMHTKNILDDYGQPQVCSPLVPRKGNQEYVTGGGRTFLLDKAGDQHCLVDFYLRAAISDCLLIGFIRATETLRKN